MFLFAIMGDFSWLGQCFEFSSLPHCLLSIWLEIIPTLIVSKGSGLDCFQKQKQVNKMHLSVDDDKLFVCKSLVVRHL